VREKQSSQPSPTQPQTVILNLIQDLSPTIEANTIKSFDVARNNQSYPGPGELEGEIATRDQARMRARS